MLPGKASDPGGTGVAAIIAADGKLTRRHAILTGIAGMGILTLNQIIAIVPELGSLDNKQAASPPGLAAVARQPGQSKGKSFVNVGRGNVRQTLYIPALVAERFNPDLAATHQQRIAAGKSSKITITSVMQKLFVTANAFLKANRPWIPAGA